MEEGHLHFSGVIGNGDGEETGILVVHMDEIDAADTDAKVASPNRFQ